LIKLNEIAKIYEKTFHTDFWNTLYIFSSGYKTRCSVHIFFSYNPDPTWLVDLICVLAIVNLCMELINISVIWCSHYKLPKTDTILGKKKQIVLKIKNYFLVSLFDMKRINVYFNTYYNRLWNCILYSYSILCI